MIGDQEAGAGPDDDGPSVAGSARGTVAAGRVRANDSLLRLASGLFGTSAVTAATGAIFWILAARLLDPVSIGVAGAALSAIVLVARLSTIGLGTVLIGELAADRQVGERLVLPAVLTAAGVGTVLGVATGAFLEVVGTGGGVLTPLGGLLVVVGIALTAAGIVVDGALIGSMRSRLQLVRNVVASLSKLVLLPVLVLPAVVGGVDAILLASVGGVALSLLLIGRALTLPPGGWRALRPVTLHHAAEGLRHHVFNLALLVAGTTLPLVAPAALGLEPSGWFYIAFTVASLAWAVPESLSVALYATGRNAPDAFAAQLRFAATLSVGLGIVGSLLTLVLAEPVLLVFGPDYAAQAADTLRILVLGIFPATILSLYAALARMQRSQLRGTLLTVAGIAVGLAAALVGARLAGMAGYALGWVLGTTLMRLPMAVSIWRATR